ncbi:MAG: glycoside hydrolase family 3 C-terminal domain-containing protein [Eubacterium sp.]|nr:glycoside hydrolase family 3 C-terminal domain-containing protein [Eubacterium sp.]
MRTDYEDRIQKLIDQMTLEEKAGQLRQCGPSLVGAFGVSFEELVNMMFDGKISQEEFDRQMGSARQDFREEELRNGCIGSYNGIADAATANRLQKIAIEETRMGIPLLFGCDVIHGLRTVMPIPLAESCAWDPKLWEKTARVAAREATAAGIHMTFSPMVDVAKDARWGRVSEGAGEDVLLNSCYGAAKVRGYQSDDLAKEDSMAACVKHFAGYGAAEAGRDYNRVDMSMQRFFEEYLPPYEACIKAGARAVMPAFNDINGVPCSVNRWLLRDILREKWGFDGMTVSDSNAIAECVSHGVAKDQADAAKRAILAGMDMDMASDSYHQYLVELVKTGEVAEEKLDQAVANVLRIKFELGLFDHPYQASQDREREELLKPEYRRLAREAAASSMVLLKNDRILPLQKDAKIGIVGALADDRAQMLGTWAFEGKGEDCVSIVDACRARGVSFTYIKGQDAAVDIESINKMAESCSVIVAAVGEKKEESGEAASRASITIPKEQTEVLKALKKTGKPVVAVLFNGRPLAIPWIAEHVDAVLEAWHPGVEAGNAVLDLLFGAVNPSGKLTVTFPYTSGQCPMYYAHIPTGRPGGKSKFTSKYLDTPLEPVYPFGYGLSYTTYEYSGLKIQQSEQGVSVSVKVKNTGKRDGAEIVQCYIRDMAAERARPVRQLAAFEKVFLKAGEEVETRFFIPYENLGYYNSRMDYIVETGWFEAAAGRNCADCLSSLFEYTGQ